MECFPFVYFLEKWEGELRLFEIKMGILSSSFVQYAALRNCLGDVILTDDNTYLIRYFDTVFMRPYRCFSITLKVILSLSDR